MRVVTRLSAFQKPEYPLTVALGNFDGVHRGHQEILRLIQKRSKETGGEAAVVTFRNHPQHVLHHNERPLLLTSFRHKLALLEHYGIRLCFAETFNRVFSMQSPEQFLKEALINTIGAKSVCMGFNARFGHHRAGDVSFMKQMQAPLAFDFLEAKPVQIDETDISSSTIRGQIQEGRLDDAARFLGRPYSFYGTVVRGAGRGRKIGFPTANLDIEIEVIPPQGVYAVQLNVMAACEEKETADGFILSERMRHRGLEGVLNFGVRPTFEKENKPLPEVHLLNFNGDLLGQCVEVIFVKKIRDEKQFADAALLAEQIQRDKETARLIFGRRQKENGVFLDPDQQSDRGKSRQEKQFISASASF